MDQRESTEVRPTEASIGANLGQSSEAKAIIEELKRKLVEKFAHAINACSAENDSNTPDFILAEFLVRCLFAFGEASRARETWYGKSLSIGGLTGAIPPEYGLSAAPQPPQHTWHQLVTKKKLEPQDKALLAAVVLLSTQHDPQRERRSFSHLTMEEIFDKLVRQYEEFGGELK